MRRKYASLIGLPSSQFVFATDSSVYNRQFLAVRRRSLFASRAAYSFTIILPVNFNSLKILYQR